jgi:HNH endonuclease
MTLQERFDAKYIPEPNSGCWLWTAGLISNGYGQFCYPGHHRGGYAHRASWEIHHGEIPEGAHVLHRCDNPCCVNPDHLFLGSHDDNMADMKSKGRARTAVGESHPKSRLTKEVVQEIRNSSNRSNVSWAKELGVAAQSISQIRLRQTWGHV